MTTIAHLMERNRKIFHWRRRLRHAHIRPHEILTFGIRNPPLPGFLADNERPLVLIRNREHGVVARRHIFPTHAQVGIRHKRGRLIRPGPPDLPVRNQLAKNLAPFHPRTGVIHLDRFAIRELALRTRRRTRPWLRGLFSPATGLRGRLAVTMDLVTDAMALVGQHGVYCQSQRWPGKPVMDVQMVMKSLADAKELIQSVMEELKRKDSSPTS